jgi:hypothetical protein
MLLRMLSMNNRFCESPARLLYLEYRKHLRYLMHTDMNLKTVIPALIVCCALSACSHPEEAQAEADVPVMADASKDDLPSVLEKPVNPSAQIVSMLSDFPLPFPKSYLLDNHISCLSVSEKAWQGANKPYLSISYDLLFDSTGTLYRIISSDPRRLWDDVPLSLIGFVDTVSIKSYDTVRYNANKQRIKTTIANYKDYYTYDHAGRLVEHTAVTPPVASPQFHQAQIVYDLKGRVVKIVRNIGNVNKGFSDDSLSKKNVCVYSYDQERLTSIRYSYKDGRVSYSKDLQLMYEGPILSKISMDNAGEDEHWRVAIHVCRKE